MKKVIIALFVLGMAVPSFAGLKVKNVVGTWSYQIETEYETMSGTLTFEKDGKGLTGHVTSDAGDVIPMTKVEIRENNVVHFEIEIDYNLLKSDMTIDGKKYKGTVGSDAGEMVVTGEKVE